MPKFELDPENNVNTNAWYDEAIIFKIWDQYIKSKKLKYFYSNSDSYDNKEHYIESIFEGKDESLLSKNAVILLNKDNSLYTRKNINNNEDCSISFCNLSSTLNTKKGPFNFNQNENYLIIALRQLTSWNTLHQNNKNTIKNHIIMFPYNISNKHWCLGTLQIKFNTSHIDAFLNIYDPLAKNTFNKKFRKTLHKLLVGGIFSNQIILNNKCNKHKIKQQNDSDSCGAIIAENGKDIIDGSENRLNQIYLPGAMNLRIQHLKEIANDIFTLRQKENKFYNDPEIQLLDNLPMIENALSDIFFNQIQINTEFKRTLNNIKINIKYDNKYDEVSAVSNIRNLFLKNKIYFKGYSIDDKNLFDLFFSDDNGSYQDKAFDTLSYIIRKLVDNEKSNQLISYHDKNNYHYPERIPNLVQRDYLKNRIKEALQTNRIAILTGLNGYGKTVLAMDYIYTHLNGETEYDYIIWLDCQELCSTSLYSTSVIKYIAWNKGTRSFDKLIKYLNLYPNNEEMHCIYFHNIRDIHKIISKEVLDKTWLIVYDNISNYADLAQESIPPNGHIICASRHKDWHKSINVGPFTLDEGIQYFTNIFFQSPESAAVEQYRDKYFENMLGTPDKAQRFQKAAKDLTKKLHGYPLALTIAAKDIREKGLTIESYMQQKKYKELSYFKDITLESFIGIDLTYINNGNKAKQLLNYCAYLNHEGITREILEDIDKKITEETDKNFFDSALFNNALNLLIYYSIINTDNSHTTDYFYIPDILKKLLLDNLAKNQELKKSKYMLNIIPDTILDIVNGKLKNHILNNNCTGYEVINPEQNIYMWVSHAKELYKNLEWRKKFNNNKINSRNKGYRLIDIRNIIDLYIRNKFPNSKSIDLSKTIDNCFLLMRANRKKYTCIDSDDGYNYSFIVSLPLNNIFLKNKKNIRAGKSMSKLSFLGKIGHSKTNSHYKILIPYIDNIFKRWITIEIRLHKFIIKNNIKYELEILAHDPYGNGDTLKNSLKNVSLGFLNHLEARLKKTNPNIQINSIAKNSNFNSQLQKNDVTSSSLIVIENIIAIIHGNPPNKTYPLGCKFIRYQHLALIERYLPVSKNKIWYENMDKAKIIQWKAFLERHWGLAYVLNKYPNNIKILTLTAKFLHFLGRWHHTHELMYEKSYQCTLESNVLYFQLICAKVLKNIEYDYDFIYNRHLKDSFYFEAANYKLFIYYHNVNYYYKITSEAPNIYLSLPHIIKAYTQLKITYNYYLNNRDNHAIFNVDKESAKKQALLTLYNLSLALHQIKKGFNEKTNKWMHAIYKIFSQLLRSNLTASKSKISIIDEQLLKNLLPNNTTDNLLFEEFEKNELTGHNLNLLELKQIRLKTSKLNTHVAEIFKSIEIPNKVLNYYKENDKKRFFNKSDIKQYINNLITKYLCNYYSLLSQNINIIFDDFLSYTQIYNCDPNKAKDISKFVMFFKLDDEKFNSLCKIRHNKINNLKSVKINDNFIDAKATHELYNFITSKIQLKLIDEKYFYNDWDILESFYSILYRKIILIYLQTFTNVESRRNINIKLNILNYIIGQVADDIINSKRNLLSGLTLQRLRINIQLEIYFLYWHFDKTTKKKLKYLPDSLIELANLANKYYDILIKNIDNVESNNLEQIFKYSGRTYYKISETAFRHFKIIYELNPHRSSKKLNSTQNKLFNIIAINLQRASNSHKIRLLPPEHRYLVNVSNLYNEMLTYLGFLTNETDANNRIENLIDIEILQKKLNTFNEYLSSPHTLSIGKNINNFNKMIIARINRAMICYMLCRYDEALSDCNKLCDEVKIYLHAFHLRANIYYNLKKFPKAIDDFNYYLQYRPGNPYTKIWLSLAKKQEELKLEHTPQQEFTPKMLFINSFTDEFLIEAKRYADISLGTNKILEKPEISARILSALSNLVPNISASVPIGPVSPTLTIKPQEASIELANIYAQQAEAKKLYIASNIARYHDELKTKVRAIAENIANDLEPQINQLQDKSIIKLAQYSAKRMLKNVGLNRTNPELPIEQQLRQGLFFWNGSLKHGKHLFTKTDNHEHWIFTKHHWTAKGVLTHAGIFTTSNHFWVQRKTPSSKGEEIYSYRYGTNEEAFRLGYTQVNKAKKNGKEHESKYRIAIPFPKKQ